MISVVQLFHEKVCGSKGWSTVLQLEHSVGMLFVSLHLSEQSLDPGFSLVEHLSRHLFVLGVPLLSFSSLQSLSESQFSETLLLKGLVLLN